MKNGGEDKIYLASETAKQNVTLKNYKASDGGGIVVSEIDIDEITEDITFGNGQVKIGNAKVTFDGNTGDSDSTVLNLFTEDGDKQAVGFTNEDGGSINVSSESDNYLLVGNYFDNKDVGSTLTGGKGDDTLIGGAGDVLNAGKGKDNLILFDAEDTTRDGAEVIVKEGTTNIVGAHDGYEETGDVLNVDLDNVNLSIGESGYLEVSGKGVHATVQTVENNDGFARQLLKNGDNIYKAIIAAEGNEISVSSGEDVEVANYYQGAAVNFSDYEESVSADLSNNTGAIDDGAAVFKNVRTLTAGAGNATFKGGDLNETLYASTGNATLYGGGGRNLLANTATDKEGSTSFFVLSASNGAHNTISGFEFLEAGEDNNSDTADVLEIGTKDGNVVSNVFIKDGKDVVIEVGNGDKHETAVVKDAVGQDMQVSNYVAQVNTKELTYDGAANFFVATEKNAKVVVGDDVATTAVVWLGTPERDGSVYIGDIRTLDASKATTKTELAGNDLDNTIIAGSEDASLWGGNGGDDLLVGGKGQNLFFYCAGNGNDTIQGTNAGDVVYFGGITMEQILGSEFSGGNVTINFTDGGKLTVDNAANCSFVIGDQTYYSNGSEFTTEK